MFGQAKAPTGPLVVGYGSHNTSQQKLWTTEKYWSVEVIWHSHASVSQLDNFNGLAESPHAVAYAAVGPIAADAVQAHDYNV